jgi:hypothetical protein
MFVYSVGSENGLDFSRATTKQIVERFEAENPEWDALVAINGDFFDIENKLTASMGEPEFPMIQMGDVYKSNILYAANGRGIVGTTADGKMLYYTVGSIYKENGYGTSIRFDGKYAIQFFGEKCSNVIAEYPASPDYYPQGTRITFLTPDSKARDLSGATVFALKCDTYRRSHVGINGSEQGTVGYFIEGDIVEVREGKAKDRPQDGEVYIATLIPESYPLLKVGEHIKCQQKAAGEWAEVENAIGFKQQILADGKCLLKNAYGTYNKGGDKKDHVDADGWEKTDNVNTHTGTVQNDNTTNSTGTVVNAGGTSDTGTVVNAGGTSDTGTINKVGSVGTTGNATDDGTDTYTKHEYGKIGVGTYQEMVMKWRESFLNIDMQIINSLGDLFMKVW